MNDTNNLDINAHSTSDSIEAYNSSTQKPSNQFFHLGPNTDSTTDVKVERHKFRTSSASPKKRPKVTHHADASSSKSKGKRKKSLSLLLEMPLDVLYEIFGHLLPRDMINLTRTSKIFRENLLSRNATTVWRAVLDREGAPECPSWISEPAWAALLFEHVCQSCGARNVQKIDFLLMRRVCLKCKKVHLVNESGMFARYPGTFNLDISGMLPATNTSSWSHKYTSKSKFYWDTDVEDMLMGISAFRQDAERGLPNAQSLMEDYVEEKKRRVEHIKEKFGLWNDWHTNKQSAKRLACILEGFSASWRKAIFSSQVIPGVVNSIPAPLDPGNLPTPPQSMDDPFWYQLFQKDVDAIGFEKEFGTMFSAEEDVPLVEEDLELFRLDRDFDQWWTETDWCNNIV